MAMVKFGLFDGESTKPSQIYEGETLALNGDVVCVIARDDKGTQSPVAVIRLAERMSVKKV